MRIRHRDSRLRGGWLHLTAGCEVRTHINECGLHVISGIAHGSRAIRQARFFEPLQGRGQKFSDHGLHLATLGHLCSGRRCGSACQMALVLTSRHTGDAYHAGHTEAQNKYACLPCSLPANTC